MKWCSRAIITSPYHYCLCLTEKQFDKVLKKHKIIKGPLDERIIGAQASANFFTKANGSLLVLVKMGTGHAELKRTEINGFLVHEATHIWQAICEYMVENSPSAEFEAYSVQKISQELMVAYERAMKKEKKCRQKK